MTYYYVEDENKILFAENNLDLFQSTLLFKPELEGLEIKETEREIIYLDEEFVFADEHQEEIAQKEREKLDMLSLTRGDVFIGLIQARMINEDTLRQQLEEQMPETTDEEKVRKMLAINALTNALNFHRGHDLVNVIGEQLGISSDNLDNFFKTGDYHYLLPVSTTKRTK